MKPKRPTVQSHDAAAAAETSGALSSFWVQDTPPEWFPELQQDLTAEIVVVGAGISGLTTAYLLSKNGRDVVLLDDGPTGGGETGRTTAHLSNALDDRYYNLLKLHGEDKTRLAAESHIAAIDRIEQIVQEENIECGFERVNGHLFLHPFDRADSLDRELEALHKIGLKECVMLERAPLASFDTGRCILFPRQGNIHPMKYLRGLTAAFQKNGGKIFTRTRVVDFNKDSVATELGNSVHAKHIVVATNTPVNDRVVIHTKQAAYRTYVLAAMIPAGYVATGQYWDTGDMTDDAQPYHYIRTQPLDAQTDLLIVGGEDHKTGQDEEKLKRFDVLGQWIRERFPVVQNFQYRWSGQVMEPVDHLAFIGKNPMDTGNIYIATGDSGNGMTHGTIAGILLTDLIEEKKNPWAEVYDPSRKVLSATGEWLSENVNVAAQYADWARTGDPEEAEQLDPGSGAVVREGLEAVACYRDAQGMLHKFSAACPHLLCVVQWNAVEKTFDCPCHGSRFSPAGEVLNGPAATGLKRIQ